MNTFHLRITSPDGDAFAGEATMLTLRGTEGDLAILANHIPFVTAVVPCRMKIETATDDIHAKVGGGLLSVSANEAVLLSSDYEVTDTEEM